ncbi:asparagine synthetase B family protein [Candidatus Methylocalor cossyra]|uniref:asparagine synthase (glutamine-hydrolyzing) n=1 Tax=Candidatus Methylocalor cossyra TaxID=3108543 RepID=A0ABM9NMG4_9GAMM
MAMLFGCHDPALTAPGLEQLLERLGEAKPFRDRRQRAVVADGACVACDGDAHQGADGVLTAMVGFPRWTDPQLGALARDLGPAAALAEAYRRHGEDLWRTLQDAFSLAVLDTARGRILLALDRIGQQHLYYARTDRGLAFGSRADVLLRVPGVTDDIDPQALFDYLYAHHCPSPGSIYRQIRKLEGAELLVFEGSRLRIVRYWLPEFQEHGVHLEPLGEELRSTLFAAVARFDGSGTPVGAFLSGGLDSSTVAGALARARPEPADTFSIGFPVPDYDEMAYARIAAEHFRTRSHEYYLTPDAAVAAIPTIAAACDEPFGNSSALPAYFCAKLAREQGMALLLAGDGGDELFGGNERYRKQLLFQRYATLPGLLRGALETGLGGLPAALVGRFPLRKLARYVEQARTPLPDRLQDYNFLHRVPLDQVFTPEFLAAVDSEAPLAAQRECYARPDNASALNRMLYLDWKVTLHDNDLVKVNRMCQLAGIEVAYPLLDDAVVQLSCRIPSALKVRQGVLRWFYKRAMTGVLPEAILNKTKHGFGLPFGVWLKDHGPLQQLAYDSVAQLKERPYFRPAFLDQAIRLHRSGHAAYFGELIWVLMMLELWFETRSPR